MGTTNKKKFMLCIFLAFFLIKTNIFAADFDTNVCREFPELWDAVHALKEILEINERNEEIFRAIKFADRSIREFSPSHEVNKFLEFLEWINRFITIPADIPSIKHYYRPAARAMWVTLTRNKINNAIFIEKFFDRSLEEPQLSEQQVQIFTNIIIDWNDKYAVSVRGEKKYVSITPRSFKVFAPSPNILTDVNCAVRSLCMYDFYFMSRLLGKYYARISNDFDAPKEFETGYFKEKKAAEIIRFEKIAYRFEKQNYDISELLVQFIQEIKKIPEKGEISWHPPIGIITEFERGRESF